MAASAAQLTNCILLHAYIHVHLWLNFTIIMVDYIYRSAIHTSSNSNSFHVSIAEFSKSSKESGHNKELNNFLRHF